MTHPGESPDSSQQGIAGLVERAEAVKNRISALSGTATSQDGAVTVTVNAGGAVQNLSFGQAAERMPRARLAASIMSALRQAHTAAARQLPAVMATLADEDSAAMRYAKNQVPAAAESGPAISSAQPQRTTRNAPPPQARRERENIDDDYDEPVSVFKTGW